MDTLNTELKNMAVADGLCSQWQSMWSHDFDKDELISMFKRGQDFCIIHDYPSLDFIGSNFTQSELQENGVFIDMTENVTLGNGTYVLMGESDMNIRIPRWCAVILYLRHTARANVIADEFSKVSIRLYDQSEVTTEQSDDARVKIYDHR